MSSSGARRLWVLLAVGSLSACELLTGEPPPASAEPVTSSFPSASGGASSSGNASSGGASSGGGTSSGLPSCTPTAGPPTTRITRLTHVQFDNVVRTLLGLADTVEPSAGFQTDSTTAGFANNADQMVVTGRLGRDYRRAAEDLGAQVVTTPALYDAVVGCTPSGDGSACARTFVTGFLRAAWRRPATTAEVDRMLQLFGEAPAWITGDAFHAGVQVVLEAVLQSPDFLYRVELSQMEGLPGLIRLGSHEVAARLSLLLWNNLPDATLNAAADNNELQTEDQVAAQVQRMLEDSRARAVVADFHSQWLSLDDYDNLARDPSVYPQFTTALRQPLKQEALRFVDDVVFTQEGGLEALYSAPFTYVNADIAALYGLQGSFDGQMTRVDLPANQRGGLFTQLGFLASHAYPITSDPIHRGVFIHRKVLCTVIGNPPAGAANTPLPPVTGVVKTMRQRVSQQTAPGNCQTCHSFINTAGFAFEHYDSIGRFQDTDNGETVDATGTLELAAQQVPFDGALEFMRGIANSQDGRNCYVKQWFRYGMQREESPEDACTIEHVAARMQAPGFTIKDLIKELAKTPAFLYRPVERN